MVGTLHNIDPKSQGKGLYILQDWATAWAQQAKDQQCEAHMIPWRLQYSRKCLCSVSCAVAGGMKMVLSPKAQGLRLSTDGLQARLAQPPSAGDVALFLHTSGGSDIF